MQRRKAHMCIMPKHWARGKYGIQVIPFCETKFIFLYFKCTWGADSAKRPSTKQYVESLKKHIEALDVYVSQLESKLAICREEHGGIDDTGLHKRPLMAPVMSVTDGALDQGGQSAEIPPTESSPNEADVDKLVATTKHLVVSTCISG